MFSGSSTLLKIGLAGLAAKKIPPVMMTKTADNDQKRTLVELSFKDREKDQHTAPANTDPRQTTLVSTISSQGLQIMVQKQEVETKHAEKKAKHEKKDGGPAPLASVAPRAATSSKRSSRDE
ncbi:Uncharacterized protein Fot_34561 [Forsythia ovata]|uniref:Uncharacterized protein n=1 Tax=Forsythia ovata TaxID=205694 RepID=A0ABD1SK30_9LAMI